MDRPELILVLRHDLGNKMVKVAEGMAFSNSDPNPPFSNCGLLANLVRVAPTYIQRSVTRFVIAFSHNSLERRALLQVFQFRDLVICLLFFQVVLCPPVIHAAVVQSSSTSISIAYFQIHLQWSSHFFGWQY